MRNKKVEDFDDQTCLRRVLGYCSHCKRDYDPDNIPNNLDCPRYVAHALSNEILAKTI